MDAAMSSSFVGGSEKMLSPQGGRDVCSGQRQC